jgi:uncharacterized protein (TIGR02301 family)
MRIVAALLLLLAAQPAAAQERSPAERQAIIELSYVLGEAHGVRTVCRGDKDQTWRERMKRLIEVEAAEASFTRRLQDSFNTGYNAARAGFTSCDANAKAEAAQIAVRGRDLAKLVAEGLGEPRMAETAESR